MRARDAKNNRERVQKRIESKDDFQLIERWAKISHTIRGELLELHRERGVMAVALEVVNANTRFLNHTGRTFMDLAYNWYAITMAVAVRRQTDNDDRSASLRVVLEELRLRPQAYRLETLRQLAPKAADTTIEEVMMRPVCSAGRLNVDLVNEDIGALIHTAKEVTDYVDHHIAHTSHEERGDAFESPTVGAIHNAMVEFERVYRRWHTALTGNVTVGFPKMDPNDWAAVFDFPWRRRQPSDSDSTRRYLVTVDDVADQTDTDIWYDFDSERREVTQSRATMELISDCQKLAIDDRVVGRVVVPTIVTVERLL
jgi:hypothetical protein